MRSQSRSIALVAMLACVAATGCGRSDRSGDELVVFAAASLTDAFDELGSAFEDAHPGVEVTFSFAGSSAVREQVLAGAPADVVAVASARDMDQLVAAGVSSTPVDIARNRLEIAVPAGNEAGVVGLDDFGDESLLIGLCAEEVPCGALGRTVLADAGVTATIDTNEPDVRSLLTKIEAGELDAGLVYRTDVLAAGDRVEGIEIPDDVDVATTYPIAVLDGARHPDLAESFVDLVLSDRGQDVLASHGFERP